MTIKKTLCLASVIFVAAFSLSAADRGAGGGSFTDSRNGQKYRTVKIGNQTWMAENLNYKADSSYCYDDADSNCAQYGRLYTWNTALSVCPKGWHLPDTAEWSTLVKAAGDEGLAAKALKSQTGWHARDPKGTNGGGTDEFGFSALPGGHRRSSDEAYPGSHDVTRLGKWWCATESAEKSNRAYLRSMSNTSDGMGKIDKIAVGRNSGCSVRCIKD